MSNGRIGPPWWLMARGGAGESRTVSGPVAHWEDKVVAPLRSLLVNIDPVQDLHGYDNPWPAGGGVNKFAIGDAAGLAVPSACYGLTITLDAINETVRIHGTPTWTNAGGHSFRIIATKNGYWGPATVNHDYVGMKFFVQIVSKSSNVTSVGGATSQEESTISIDNLVVTDTNAIDLKIKICISESSVTSWSPYSNICPISGWSAVNVWVKPTYDPTADPTATLQLGQTVYGGTLDVTNGVLTVEWAKDRIGDMSWVYDSGYSRMTSTSLSSVIKRGSVAREIALLCDSYQCIADKRQISNVPDMSIYEGGNGFVYIHDSRYTDANSFKTNMGNSEIVYPLATTITIPLTPQEISTLQGTNNLWVDTGDVTVEYLSGEGNPALVALALAHRIEE